MQSKPNQGDGYSDDPNAIPYGSRLQLDPTFDINTIQDPAARAIARALQEYGAWFVDTGGSFAIYAREFVVAGGGSVDRTPWRNLINSSYQAHGQIPWDRLRILEPAQQSEFYVQTSRP